jgi:ribonuclease HI
MPAVPPWLMPIPKINFSLHGLPKAYNTPAFHKMQYFEYTLSKLDFCFVFTDGSKADGVGSAAVLGKNVYSCRIDDDASVFTAEAYAILLALRAIEGSRRSKFVIFSDSFSCLQAILSCKWQNPAVLDILEAYKNLFEIGKDIRFCWIPSHTGIHGNEAADAAAKSALNKPVDKTVCIPYTDFKYRINKYYQDKFQNLWNNSQFNKLHIVKPTIGGTKFTNIINRRDETVLHRARLGHTFATHSYLLRRENAPECTQCQCMLTVDHILLECPMYHIVRQKYYTTTNRRKLFNKISPRKILGFLKEIKLYDKL